MAEEPQIKYINIAFVTVSRLNKHKGEENHVSRKNVL